MHQQLQHLCAFFLVIACCGFMLTFNSVKLSFFQAVSAACLNFNSCLDCYDPVIDHHAWHFRKFLKIVILNALFFFQGPASYNFEETITTLR